MANKQNAGRCIFCNGSGLTKQHVVPDWMSVLMVNAEPVSQSRFVHSVGMASQLDEVLISSEDVVHKNYSTIFGQMRYRNVCLNCNGGWISKIEQASKVILEPMIVGEDLQIPVESSKLISLALAMIAVMHEFTDDADKRIITSEHRRYIMRTNRLPAGWFVAVGKMQEGSATGARSKFNKAPGIGAFSISTFAIGRLLVQVVICEQFVYPVSFPRDTLRQVWPVEKVEDNRQENALEVSTEGFRTVADFLYLPMSISFARHVKRSL